MYRIEYPCFPSLCPYIGQTPHGSGPLTHTPITSWEQRSKEILTLSVTCMHAKDLLCPLHLVPVASASLVPDNKGRWALLLNDLH